MSGVFRNMTTPLTARRECPIPRLWCAGRTHSLGGEGLGVNSSEDARHCSILYICKYILVKTEEVQAGEARELDKG